MPNTDNTYTCEACGGIFPKGWSDEEANAEALETFGIEADDPEAALVCDDCYMAMGFRGANETWEEWSERILSS